MAHRSSSQSSDQKSRSRPKKDKTETSVSELNHMANKSKHLANSEMAGLSIVSTPIGNSGDLTHRAVNVLTNASLIACEDTRVTAKILHIYGIRTPTISYHEYNSQKQLPRILTHLKKGDSVALVCDAGTPLISDPGYRLVNACINISIPVSGIPGPSSVLAALVISGLPTDQFFFQGFLPSKPNARLSQLRALAHIPGSLVFLESAKRLPVMLSNALEALGNRRTAVCRELTKKFEEVTRGNLEDLATTYAQSGPPRGEVCVVVGPATHNEKISDTDLDQFLIQELEKNSVRDASINVASITGLPKRQIYARALALTKQNS